MALPALEHRDVSGETIKAQLRIVDHPREGYRGYSAACPSLSLHCSRSVVDPRGIAAGQPTVEVGSVVGLDVVSARLRAKGFSRHTFLCGQSGSDHVHLAEIRGDAEADALAATYRSTNRASSSISGASTFLLNGSSSRWQ